MTKFALENGGPDHDSRLAAEEVTKGEMKERWKKTPARQRKMVLNWTKKKLNGLFMATCQKSSSYANRRPLCFTTVD